MNKKLHIISGALAGLLALSAFLLGCNNSINPALNPISEPTTERLEAVHFIDESTGFIAGGLRFESSRLYRTDDQGDSWQEKEAEREYEKILFELNFVDAQRGFATGFDGKILRTLDGGNSWDLTQSYAWLPLHSIDTNGDSIVVAAGGNGYDFGIIHRSADFGETWEMVDTFNFELRDIVFLNEKRGLAAGYSAILETNDGGLTWDYTTAVDEFFASMSFPSSITGYAVGRTGTIIKTTDGGKTWEKLRNGNHPWVSRHAYNKVVFLNAEVGYIVGDRGLILKTSDGGKKWQRFERNTKAHLYDIFLFEEGRGIIVGDEGTILHFQE